MIAAGITAVNFPIVPLTKSKGAKATTVVMTAVITDGITSTVPSNPSAAIYMSSDTILLTTSCRACSMTDASGTASASWANDRSIVQKSRLSSQDSTIG